MRPAAPELARFVSALRCEDLPPAAVDAARRHLLDTFGVAIRGRTHANAANSLRGLESADGASGRATVWGGAGKLSSAYAALANGIAAHVLDFDDTHTDSIVHGSAIVAPVVMALGEERGAGGDDLLAAFVAGWEVAARVGLASRGTFHKRGFHTTSIAGVFGAAAAAARMLRLDAGEAAHALALAGSQASGINEYLSNGSSAKSLHPGWSAHAGILAATLARSGMTGPMSVFEGRDGLLRAYGLPAECDAGQLDADLGSRWETTRISIKPYPCCHFAHAFVDCVGALLGKGIAARDIAALHCVVPEIELPLICEPFEQKLAPATPYAAKFSLPYVLAARIADGRIDHASFEPASISRPELLALAARVTYRVAAADETPFPRTFPGWVEATLADGRKLVERLDVNRGHPDNPLSLEQVAAKFRDNAVEALGEPGVARVIDLVRALPATAPAELARALAAPAHIHQLNRRKTP
jgi:2-methylcitrate dehydratase PrpD